MSSLMKDSARFAALQSGYSRSRRSCGRRCWRREQPTVAPTPATAGSSQGVAGQPYYSYLKQSYLLAARFLGELAEAPSWTRSPRSACSSR
jgi:hypothetical protein